MSVMQGREDHNCCPIFCGLFLAARCSCLPLLSGEETDCGVNYQLYLLLLHEIFDLEQKMFYTE
jgi:hypothetical protein